MLSLFESCEKYPTLFPSSLSPQSWVQAVLKVLRPREVFSRPGCQPYAYHHHYYCYYRYTTINATVNSTTATTSTTTTATATIVFDPRPHPTPPDLVFRLAWFGAVCYRRGKPAIEPAGCVVRRARSQDTQRMPRHFQRKSCGGESRMAFVKGGAFYDVGEKWVPRLTRGMVLFGPKVPLFTG